MANPFCHVELHSGDTEKSKSFYKGLFDWSMQDMDMGEMTYTMIDVGEGTGGGLMKTMCPEGTSNWLSYVHVVDVDASTGKAKALGAEVLKEKQEVPGMGWFTIIKDPTGAMLGLWQAAPAKE